MEIKKKSHKVLRCVHVTDFFFVLFLFIQFTNIRSGVTLKLHDDDDLIIYNDHKYLIPSSTSYLDFKVKFTTKLTIGQGKKWIIDSSVLLLKVISFFSVNMK